MNVGGVANPQKDRHLGYNERTARVGRGSPGFGEVVCAVKWRTIWQQS
jgi:hypothetical protein